jgi:hypothetical protein
MKSLLKKYAVYIAPIVCTALLLGVLYSSSPLAIGPAGILLVFGLIYAVLASLLYALLTMALAVAAYFSIKPQFSRKLLYYIASIVALAPVFLLALNSIGQLEVKDFILVILLVGLACFYVVRRSRVKSL